MSSGLEAWNGMGAFGELQAKRERDSSFKNRQYMHVCMWYTLNSEKKASLSPPPVWRNPCCHLLVYSPGDRPVMCKHMQPCIHTYM